MALFKSPKTGKPLNQKGIGVKLGRRPEFRAVDKVREQDGSNGGQKGPHASEYLQMRAYPAVSLLSLIGPLLTVAQGQINQDVLRGSVPATGSPLHSITSSHCRKARYGTAFVSNPIDDAIGKPDAILEASSTRQDAAPLKDSFYRDLYEEHVEKLFSEPIPHLKRPLSTVYELISTSKSATKFAEVIDRYPSIVALLNSTTSNFTVLVPTNTAFEKLFRYDIGSELSNDSIYDVLKYHISGPYIFPASFITISPSLPTLLHPISLNGPQRWRIGWGLKGLAVNADARVTASDIYGSNGVIHVIDSVLIPPPKVRQIIEQMPGELSTLAIALSKVGSHLGNQNAEPFTGTCFAPSNKAFKKLGAKANAFLFSGRGRKYLEALLRYHFVPNTTLYSNARYNTSHASAFDYRREVDMEEWPFPDNGYHFFPKGIRHYTLPTYLDDQNLYVEIDRFGPLISEGINGQRTVPWQNILGSDGVMHILDTILVPLRRTAGESEPTTKEGGLDAGDVIERLRLLTETS